MQKQQCQCKILTQTEKTERQIQSIQLHDDAGP